MMMIYFKFMVELASESIKLDSEHTEDNKRNTVSMMDKSSCFNSQGSPSDLHLEDMENI